MHTRSRNRHFDIENALAVIGPSPHEIRVSPSRHVAELFARLSHPSCSGNLL